MNDLKYENLVLRLQPEHVSKTVDGQLISGSELQAYFRGASQIPGSRFNVGYNLVTKPILIDPYPHTHPSDEYLIFGAETLNSKDWDALAELTIGLGDDAEVYQIDETMTVRIPAGVWHGPLNFIRVDKPVFFQAALIQGMYSGTYLTPDGERELTYNGDIDCVLKAGKKCDCCKNCLSRSWEK